MSAHGQRELPSFVIICGRQQRRFSRAHVLPGLVYSELLVNNLIAINLRRATTLRSADPPSGT
jgi:hypothetical protein